MGYNYEKELQEAIAAGRKALNSLQIVKHELDGARNWGVLDILGGGLVSSLVKHSKLNNASTYMENARYDLRSFQREINDVTINTNIDIEVGDFLSFADFFFDGFVVDVVVQSEIKKAQSQVDEAIYRVESIIKELEKME